MKLPQKRDINAGASKQTNGMKAEMSPKPRILFVEDDQDSREVTCLFLKSQGFQVICADNASQALQIAKDQHVDAYLLDNWLPEVSGPELCRQIRRFDSHTPVVFYSAAGHATDQEAALNAGAQFYIVKPVEPDDLVNALRSVMPCWNPLG